MAAPYSDRLRLEGAVLAGFGLAGAAALLATKEQARRWPHSTVGQLAIFGAVLARRGPRSIAEAIANARMIGSEEEVSGEPTPLWHVPAPVVAGVLYVAYIDDIKPSRFTKRAGWDAALRVTLGAAIAGAFQALVAARQVAEVERELGVRFYRLPGSRLGKGTVLGFKPNP